MISRLLNVAKNEVGAAMVEFAIVLPLLLVVLLGIVQFAIFFYQYVIVENAAATGARTFVTNRPYTQPSNSSCNSGCPTACYTPYSSTVSAIQTATGGLAWSNVTYTMSANGSTCSSDAACGTNLCNAYSYSVTGPFSLSAYGKRHRILPVPNPAPGQLGPLFLS